MAPARCSDYGSAYHKTAGCPDTALRAQGVGGGVLGAPSGRDACGIKGTSAVARPPGPDAGAVAGAVVGADMSEGRVGEGMLPITGVVLAGGAGRRMGGQDKGFVSWSGAPLIHCALQRVAGLPQVLISANRSLDRYRALGHEVVTDLDEGFAGPLAGLRAAFRRAAQPWVVSVPVDAPCLPPDLVARLWRLRIAGGVVVARSPSGPEPLVFLADARLGERLEAYWRRGGRRAQEWFTGAETAWLDLSAAEAANCNTPEDLR